MENLLTIRAGTATAVEKTLITVHKESCTAMSVDTTFATIAGDFDGLVDGGRRPT